MTFVSTLARAGLMLALTLSTNVAVSAAPAGDAQTGELPAYAVRAPYQTIKGTVRSIDGKYLMTVQDERGYLDRVSLHDGTIINPTGWTLRPGQTVTIIGQAQDATFVANEIDTPYQFAVVPSWPAYGWGWGYGFGFGGGLGPWFGPGVVIAP